MRHARSLLPLLTLATVSTLSCSILVDAPAPGTAARVTASAPPPRDADLDAVQAHLERHARRTGLTEVERSSLARTLVEEARRQRLDPHLVLAVMHVESRYDTFAVSDKDAMGLMQILPSTGEWLAAQVGVTWMGPQSLFDPIVNTRLGVAYLRMLIDRYDGDVHAALVAYNWGPRHVDGRLRQGAPLPAEYSDLVLRAYGRQARHAVSGPQRGATERSSEA